MTDTKTEIKQWLKKALAKENLKDISIENLSTSEKGDGFIGDIVFVTVKAINITTNQQQNLDLVLKCSKKSAAFRESTPVKEIFYNEIAIYDIIIPEFQQFQKSKSVQNIFDSVPKYYGHFTNETTEIIVMENLKKIGYDLWDQRKPLTKKHILMVVKNYGKFHGISGAIQDQNPELFSKLTGKLEGLRKKMEGFTAIQNMLDLAITEIYDLLKGNCDEDILQKFLHFKKQVPYVYTEMLNEGKEDFRIISHGDCWNNNFMWKHYENDKTVPEKVAIVDWQASSLISPIKDLSYFLFSCISQEDLNNLDTILDAYYTSFSQTIEQLGSNAENLYSKENFLNDWQKYARYGFGNALLITKLGFTKKENLPDIAKAADEGKTMAETYIFEISDSEGFKKRIKPNVEFAVKNKII